MAWHWVRPFLFHAKNSSQKYILSILHHPMRIRMITLLVTCSSKNTGHKCHKRISIHFHILCQINAVFFVRNASNLNVKLAWREIVEQPEMSLLPSEPSAHINNPNQTVMRHFGADPCASFIKDRMKKKTSRSSITVEFVTIKRQTHINSQLQNKPKSAA